MLPTVINTEKDVDNYLKTSKDTTIDKWLRKL